MLATSYDAALRREELRSLTVADIDLSRRLLRIRAETTKNHQERVVPYSSTTAELFSAHASEGDDAGPFWLSGAILEDHTLRGIYRYVLL